MNTQTQEPVEKQVEICAGCGREFDPDAKSVAVVNGQKYHSLNCWMAHHFGPEEI